MQVVIMPKLLARLSILILLLSFGNLPAQAFICSAPYGIDRLRVTEDGKYVVVFIYPGVIQPQDQPRTDKTLRAKYPETGFYRNDSLAALVWKLYEQKYYTGNQKYFSSEDGKFLLEVNNGTYKSLVFYKEGKPYQSYDITDFSLNPCTVCEGLCPWQMNVSYDSSKGRVLVRTTLNEDYEFEMATGKLVYTTRQQFSWLKASSFIDAIRVLFHKLLLLG